MCSHRMYSRAGAEMPEFNYSTPVGSNKPGSVTWLATPGISKIHAVNRSIHIEKITTLGAPNM